jgi:acetolactate synthase small subunit
VTYVDHRGVLRDVLAELTRRGAGVTQLSVDRSERDPGLVAVTLELVGKTPAPELAGAIAQLDGVVSVHAGDPSND